MKRLAVLISFSGDGGVERMVINLCAEFVRHVEVDLLAIRADGGHVERIPSAVRLIRLKARHAWTAVPEIERYLRERRPDALLVAKDRAGRAAIRARRRAGAQMPLWIRLGTNLSAALERRNAFNRWLRIAPMRRLYPLASGVIAVSEGVKRDTQRVTGLPAGRITVIRNPVITPMLAEHAAEAVPHPWLADKLQPVVVGMGRLTQQKDFPTLLRAFAALQRERPSRLILLGVLALLTLYTLIVARGLVIALRGQDTFQRILAGGLSLTFFLYVFINIGMVMGLMPVVGVPLPLVSFGGTSMVSLMAGFGILMSIQTHRKLISS